MADGLILAANRYDLASETVVPALPEPGAESADALARSAVVTEPEAVASRPREVWILAPAPPRSISRAALAESAEAVVSLLELPAGWNSYSAKPIELRNAGRAIQLLSEFLEPDTPSPAVIPTVRGGIQLEWHREGVNLEIYIESPDDVSFFAERIGCGEICETPLAGHEDELKSWLKRITGR